MSLDSYEAPSVKKLIKGAILADLFKFNHSHANIECKIEVSLLPWGIHLIVAKGIILSGTFWNSMRAVLTSLANYVVIPESSRYLQKASTCSRTRVTIAIMWKGHFTPTKHFHLWFTVGNFATSHVSAVVASTEMIPWITLTFVCSIIEFDRESLSNEKGATCFELLLMDLMERLDWPILSFYFTKSHASVEMLFIIRKKQTTMPSCFSLSAVLLHAEIEASCNAPNSESLSWD